MLRRLTLTLFTVFTFFTPLSPSLVAQAPKVPSGLRIEPPKTPYEVEITFLKSPILRKPGPEQEDCGNYFKYTPPPSGRKDKAGMLFIISSLEKDGVSSTQSFLFGTDKFQVRVVPELSVPRMFVFHTEGKFYPWAEIRISPKDFGEAPCLQNVKLVGE